MVTLQDKPKMPGSDIAQDDSNFFFFIGDRIVGHVQADCCVCAWRQGRVKFPGTRMASEITLPNGQGLGFVEDQCIHEANRRLRASRHQCTNCKGRGWFPKSGAR